MNKNRIGGLRWRASELAIAKPTSIKLTGGRSGGGASKAVELTLGDLRHVAEVRPRVKRFILTMPQKSAEGEVLQNNGGRSERYPARGIKGRASKRRDS